jgi:hypothetical protein
MNEDFQWSTPIVQAIKTYCAQFANDTTAAVTMHNDLGTRVNPSDMRRVRASMSREEFETMRPLKVRKPKRSADSNLDDFVMELEAD